MERLTRHNINVDPGTDRFLHAAIGGKDIFRKMARDLYGRLLVLCGGI